MKYILNTFFLVLLAGALPAQTFDDVTKAIPYFEVIGHDSTLAVDPFEPDSVQFPALPGQLFAAKGEMMQLTTTYSDNRPEMHADWYELRYAGEDVATPNFPPPPLSKLPRNHDGWMRSTAIRLRAVSFDSGLEDYGVVLPNFNSELIEADVFFETFEQRGKDLTLDKKTRYLNDTTFVLRFDNGKEKQYVTNLPSKKGKDTQQYVGLYTLANMFLIEKNVNGKREYLLVNKADGSLAGSIDQPVDLPQLTNSGEWFITIGEAPGKAVNYLYFHKVGDNKAEEQFTIVFNNSKVDGYCWSQELGLLMRLAPMGAAGKSSDSILYHRFLIDMVR